MKADVSVLLAVRDVADVVHEQLAALASQATDRAYEVLVADTGSIDGTLDILRAWAARWPGLTVFDLGPRVEYAVPDELLAAASADRLAFCDGDDVVASCWVDEMATALDQHRLVTGPLELRRLNPPCVLRGQDPDGSERRPAAAGGVPFGLGCNLGIRRELFDSLGGFDRSLASGHDRDLSIRAQLAGVPLHWAPGAVVHRRLRHRPLAAFRQHARYGRSNARLHARGAPVADGGCRWLGAWLWLAGTSPAVPVWRAHRLHWCRVAGLRWGRLAGSARFGTWCP